MSRGGSNSGRGFPMGDGKDDPRERDAAIAVESYAELISTKGGTVAVNKLALKDDALRTRLAETWSMHVGSSNSVLPEQANSVAVELLVTWATVTGRSVMIPYYRAVTYPSGRKPALAIVQ